MALVKLAEQQEITEQRLRSLRASAEQKYPGEDPLKALLMSSKSERANEKLFFMNEYGERVTYLPSFRFNDKEAKLRTPRWYDCEAYPRVFRVLKFPMDDCDRPRKKWMVRAVQHCSENQWALPLDHKNHFSHFPQDIKELIFKFIVTRPKNSAVISPHTIACNWKSCYILPNYRLISLTPPLKRLWPACVWTDPVVGLRDGDKGVEYADDDLHDGWDEWWDPTSEALMYLRAERRDKHGVLYEIRRCYRPRIDASALRTCKSMQHYGAKMLYALHTFQFGMLNQSWKGFDVWGRNACSPPNLNDYGEQFRPPPYKPEPHSANYDFKIRQGIMMIREQVSQYSLRGWIFYDPFLRFLHTIGPRNAASLTSLSFRGTIRTHHCSEYDYDAHPESCNEDDLVQSLRLYIPFIRELCPAVKTLYIKAVKDKELSLPWSQAESILWEDIITPFLLHDIRTVESLRELQLVLPSEALPPVVTQTIEFFKERALQLDRALIRGVWDGSIQRERELAETVSLANLHCGWCGERHVWAECHNLCNYCGDGRHTRKHCPALRGMREPRYYRPATSSLKGLGQA